MIKLEQYKEIIHKCSKCGLCQECCPIYRGSGNECSTARGILIMLKGVIQKDLPVKKSLNKYLDLCLRCGKCSKCCPSEIPFEEIVFAAKRKYLYSTVPGLIKRVMQSEFITKNFKKTKRISSVSCDVKAVYLGQNSTKAVKILNENGIELLNDIEIDWGLEYLLSGNVIRFKKNFRKVINLLIEKKTDFIVADIPSESLKQIIKIFTGQELRLKIRYLGEFSGAEELVCKYFNEYYADRILNSIKAKEYQ